MKVSVVVPAFDAERWIEESLSSVASQDGVSEVIVVDDHSGDRTGDVARSFFARNRLPGEVVTTDRNEGPAHARNVGWRRARGEWIQFLDADDLLAPGKIAAQSAVASGTSAQAGVLYSPWQQIALVDGRWIPYGPTMRPRFDQDAVVSIVNDLQFGYVGPALVRRTALEAVGGFDQRLTLGEDFDLMLRIAMAGYGFRSVDSPGPLFFYRDTPASLWRRSAVDPAAVMQLDHSVRAAHLYLRESGELAASITTKAALAQRYSQHLEALYVQDPGGFKLVVSWVRELNLRRAQPGSHLPVRIMATVAGLATTLKLKYGLREASGKLTRRRDVALAGGAAEGDSPGEATGPF